MNVRNHYVYAYLDPTIKKLYHYGDFGFAYEPFYVGKGIGNRMYDHLKVAKGIKKQPPTDNIHKINRIRSILKNGVDPIIVVVFKCLREDTALMAEEALIDTIGRRGIGDGPLVNKTIGGGGLRNPTPESREKMSKSHRGRDPWNKGKTGIYSDETRKKISASLTGRKSIPLTQYQKDCISMVHKNKIVSEETKKKLSDSHKGQIAWNKGLKGAQVAWNKGLKKDKK